MPMSHLRGTFLSFRPLIACILTTQMLVPAGLMAQMTDQIGAGIPVGAQMDAVASSKSVKAGGQIDSDERILHALSRFTYGPRPGDVERVKTMGLSAWFAQQMAPAKIDDSALEAKLVDFPAMSLPLDKMMEAYPTRAMIRQVEQGKISNAPRGEAEHAIYADQMAREKDKKKADAKGNGADTTDGPAISAEERQSILALPPDQRFSALCKMKLPELQAFRRSLRGEDREQLTEGFTPQQLEELAAFQNPQGVVATETLETKLLRDIYTERQMNEVMVDFWLNHFNVYIKKSQQAPYYIAAYEHKSIRPRAFGKFEDLLVATAMSPAMLNYLDNSSSVGPNSVFANRLQRGNLKKAKPTGLNENYARELMELHTLGVGGGYTQHDVTEVAKVFTGWTVAGKRNPFTVSEVRRRDGTLVMNDRGVDEPSQAQFDESKHEPGAKTVLGVTIKENGEKEGLEVLHLLATSPATANFISRKLAVRFVADEPPQLIVDRMAKAFTSTGGDIRQVMAAMINSPEFWTRDVYRSKLKTPQEFVVSAIRASNADVTSSAALVGVMGELGMPLFGMQTPNGYSMKADPWNNTGALVSRMNFALGLTANKVPGVTTDWPAMVGPADQGLTPEAKDKMLESKLLHLAVSDRTRQTILNQITTAAQQEANLQTVNVKGAKREPLLIHQVSAAAKKQQNVAQADAESALAAGLLFGSPEFQRR